MCDLPEDEVSRMDKERRQHPLGSQLRPQDVVLCQQEEEGGQVRQNVHQAQYHIKEREFEHCNHPGKGSLYELKLWKAILQFCAVLEVF